MLIMAVKYKEVQDIPLFYKFLLTVHEASIYFGIGENKLRELIANDSPIMNVCILRVGTKQLIKRTLLEERLLEVVEI